MLIIYRSALSNFSSNIPLDSYIVPCSAVDVAIASPFLPGLAALSVKKKVLPISFENRDTVEASVQFFSVYLAILMLKIVNFINVYVDIRTYRYTHIYIERDN